MPRFQPLASDSLHPRLSATCIAAFLCFGSAQAAKPVAMEEPGAIDTTFGEDPPMPPPVPAQADTAAADLADSAIAPSSDAPSAAEAMEPTEPLEDGAFEDVFAPGETYERNWSLDFRTSLGGSDLDSTTRTVWMEVSRGFGTDVASFSPRLGWNRASRSPDDLVTHLGVFGASASWMPSMDHTLGLDAEWTTQEGPDDWRTSADWTWDRELSELASLSAGVAGGWSGLSRGFSGASLDATTFAGSWIGSVGASWNRRWQDYLDATGTWTSEYVDAWGWSTSLRWTSGSWTTGPAWTGEYWKTSSPVDVEPVSTGDAKLAKASAKRAGSSTVSVSSSGVVVDQTLSWMVAWKPIESLRAHLDVSRSFGQSAVSTRSATTKKIAAKRGADAVLPVDSYGGTFGVSFDW